MCSSLFLYFLIGYPATVWMWSKENDIHIVDLLVCMIYCILWPLIIAVYIIISIAENENFQYVKRKVIIKKRDHD